jgi:hypothetical protein
MLTESEILKQFIFLSSSSLSAPPVLPPSPFSSSYY